MRSFKFMKHAFVQFFALRKSLWLTLLLWLGIVSIFFAPAVYDDKVVAPIDCLENVHRPIADKPIEEVKNQFVVDAVSQYLPYKWAIKKSIDEDGYIGWNPYTFNGNPTADNTMATPGDLCNWLYAVFPFWTAWDLSIILKFFVAGVGMILLMRYYKMPIWGCLLAAVSFAFYSQFILWIYHRWLEAMIWAPYVVWAMLKYRCRTVNIPAIIFMALLWRTGHLQSCVFGFMVVACVWVSAVWKKGKHWPSLQEVARITFSCFLIGAFGALLSLDVFVDTLSRMGGCKTLKAEWGGNNVLTLGTLLFPFTLGMPHTLDCAKIFGLTLFDIKFGGSIVSVLAIIACFNKRAPREAKVLFLLSLLATCTPLLTYLYSRSTLVMALGMVWLAVWQLVDLTKNPFNSAIWKRIGYAVGCVVIFWIVASVLIVIYHDSLVAYVYNVIKSSPALVAAPGRVAWFEIRVERFFSEILIWHWRNVISVVCLVVGLFCCYRIKVGRRYNCGWGSAVLLLTCVEMFVFSLSWVTYSDKPHGPYLYEEPAWMPELRHEVRDGSLAFLLPVADSDFWGNNQFSGYDIRIADGYETFRPKYLLPFNHAEFDARDYAQAGISHIFVDTKWKDVTIPGWREVMNKQNFKLCANPLYQGRYLVDDISPIHADWRTCNRIQLSLPKNSATLTVLESYHPGWKAYCGSEELKITATERGGMRIAIPDNAPSNEVLMVFSMPYHRWYYAIMLLAALTLSIVAVKQYREV